MIRMRDAAFLAATITVCSLPASAQQAPSLEETISRLPYREIGPAGMGGRISDFAVVESSPQVFYMGTAAGGLWKTVNHGTSWTPLFDDQPAASIGDVAIDQSNPNRVWVGTGEPQNRQSSPWGNGVYKSTDGGATWSHMGLEESRHIGRIVIDPTNPDIVYVAAVGDLWGPNPERGVYRTTDGGDTWDLVLYVDENTGAIDLAMDPSDPKTVFAAMYQRRRTGWGFNGGGPGSGLYRTMDGGDSWTELTEGLPAGNKGRIGVDVYRRDGNLVYALVEADARRPSQGFGGGGGGSGESGLFRSTDRGTTWEKVSDTDPRPMYFSQIHVDPNNPNRVYVLGNDLMVSEDGGKTFRGTSVQVHVDQHAFWVDPSDSNHMLLGGDGGVSASWDAGAHWRQFDNLALGQFYTIAYDMRDPYYVCGGLQDADPWCGPSNTRSFHGIRNQDWYETAYGDGFWTVVDPTDSTIVFSESQNGNMNRYDLTTGEKTPMRPITGPRESGDTAKEYRFNWNSPLMISRHDPATIFLGNNYLMRSRDRGMSWEEVGGRDLTKQIDRDTLPIMDVPGDQPMMSIHDGTDTYGNITTIAESRFDARVLWVGTDDGNVQRSTDDGATWTNLVGNFPGLPPRTYVSRITPSAHDAARVYATFDGHRNGDYAPYVYISEDTGRTWRRIDAGLPQGWSVNVITEHERNPDLLFVGNEIGVYVSIDRGASWARLKSNLPTVAVDDIAIHPRDNDLLLGTHGRSAWIMDDITPLEQLSRSVMAQAGEVFPMKTTTMWAERGDWPFYGATYSAANPPRATRVRYYLRDAQDDSVDIEITDASGAHVRTLTGPGEAGINEVLWDWRYDAPYVPVQRAGAGGGGGGRFGGAPTGPIVMPGTYTASLALDGQSWSATVQIEADPRRPMTVADRRARQDALIALYHLAKPLDDATRGAQRISDQLDEAGELLDGHADAPASLTSELSAMREEVGAILDGLREARGWTGVQTDIQGSSTLPTEDQLWQVDVAWDAVPSLVQRLNTLITNRVPAFNTALDAEGVRPDPGEPLAVPRRGG